MTRTVGTVVRGIRTPIIKEDTNLADVVVNSIMEAQKEEGFTFHDRDIIAITEAVVGISEGNFIKVDDIAYDIKNKYPDGEVGIIYPILSRNRFSLILKGIARGCKKIYMLLSFPKDEVGNSIIDLDTLENSEFDLGNRFPDSLRRNIGKLPLIITPVFWTLQKLLFQAKLTGNIWMNPDMQHLQMLFIKQLLKVDCLKKGWSLPSVISHNS